MSLTFLLTKWYMDLVTDDGEALVAYAAEVRFRALSLSYASLLQHRGGHTRVTSSLRRAMPALDGKKLTWSSRALAARGTWTSEADPITETLLANDEGTVEWRCVMPLARAEIELAGGSVVRGLGYVEELTTTIAPWDLPLTELRWGRFTADGASVVWIDWRGPHEKKVIVKHGARVAGVVDDGAVEMPEDDSRVVLGPPTVLRDGPLGGGPLAAIAELHALLPAKLLAVVERKVCAPATLEQASTPKIDGWAIAEVVTWG